MQQCATDLRNKAWRCTRWIAGDSLICCTPMWRVGARSSGILVSAQTRRSAFLGSLRPNPGGPDHLLPLRDLAADVRVEFLGAVADELEPLAREAGLHLRALRDLRDLRVEAHDDRLRRARRRND